MIIMITILFYNIDVFYNNNYNNNNDNNNNYDK